MWANYIDLIKNFSNVECEQRLISNSFFEPSTDLIMRFLIFFLKRAIKLHSKLNHSRILNFEIHWNCISHKKFIMENIIKKFG